jgi:serine/threonine-protein kinase
MRVLMAHIQDPPRSPSLLQAGTPADLEGIILRCLAKAPSERYAEVRHLDRALAECGAAGRWSEEDAADWWRSQPAASHADGGVMLA